MRLFKKLNAALALALTLALVTPVVAPVTTTAVAEAATIKLSKKKKNLKVGKSFKLKVKGTSEKATFESSDTNIAKVNAKGKVTAVAAGKATITVTVADKTLTCKVTVKGAANPAVAAAPFEAKEVKLGTYTAALPKDWQVTESDYQGIPLFMLLPNDADMNTGSSSISVTVAPNEASIQEYFDLFAEQLYLTLTKEALEATLQASLGDAATISNFAQEEKEYNIGKVFVTSYTLTITVGDQSTSMTQIIYDIFANGYTTEVTVTDNGTATTPDIYEVSDYLLNSLLYVK